MKELALLALLLTLSSCGGFNLSSLADLAADNATIATAATASLRQPRRSKMADGCMTTVGSSGTCMSRFNCMRLGGTVGGPCGTYGICCETNLACGAVSKLKRTIIQSPTSLSSLSTCQYTIEPLNSNVCQLLIQFQRFELQQPTLNGGTLECGDFLAVDRFELCGDNTGQHLYIPFNVAAGVERISLTFSLPNRWTGTNWNLVVTQLECPVVKRSSTASNAFAPFMRYNGLDDLRTIFSTHHSDVDLLAPSGCDQYYTASTGNIKSFNYVEGMDALYLSNLNYVMCFKQPPGATDIIYTVRRFSLNKGNPLGEGIDLDCHSDVRTPGRPEDYLMIPQSQFFNEPSFQPTYYCGTSLMAQQMLQALPPFMIYFKSDEQTEDLETGFSIDYRINSVLVG